jgi:hypothetical protein
MYQSAIHGFLSIPLFEPAAHEALEAIVDFVAGAGRRQPG